MDRFSAETELKTMLTEARKMLRDNITFGANYIRDVSVTHDIGRYRVELRLKKSKDTAVETAEWKFNISGLHCSATMNELIDLLSKPAQ
jgi:hypothetical protein